MNSILSWLAQNTIVTALMIPPVMLACRLFRNRPAVQHLLWVVVLVKLMTPPLVLWPWSISTLQEAVLQRWATTAQESTDRRAGNPVMPGPRVPNSLMSTGTNSISTVELDRAEISGTSHLSARLLEPQAMVGGLLVVWIAGMILAARRLSAAIRRYIALVRQGSPASKDVVQQVEAVARSMGQHAPPVIQVSGLGAPFVWCLGSLKLVWPESLATPSRLQDVQSVIAHELAHIRRRDHWVAWLELAAGVIWWWNPLVWFVRRRLHEAAELSCDAVALATCSEERRTYAELLLTLATNLKSRANAPVLGVNDCTPAFFEQRLTMILSDRVSGTVSSGGMIAALGLAMLALPGWSLAQQVATDPAAASQATSSQPRNKADSDAQPATNVPGKKAVNGSGLRTITGRVVDDKQLPVSGAKLWWEVAYINSKWIIVSGTSDDQGKFSLSTPDVELPMRTSGFDTLWVLKEDKLLTAVRANSGLLYPRLPGELVIQLEKLTDTAFHLVSGKQPPMAGTDIEPYYFRGPLGHHIVPEPIRKLLRVKTDEQGWVRMPNMRRKGFHAVRATSDFYGIQDFQFPSTGSEPAERLLTLRPTGKIEGQLTAGNPDWVKGVQLYLATNAGPTTGPTGSEGFAMVTTDEQGRFVVPAIAVGELRIDVASRQDFPALLRIPKDRRVTETETTVLKIPYESSILVRGSIRTQDTKKPVPKVEISVHYGNGIGRQFDMVVSDAEGQFEARVLAGEVSTHVLARPAEFNDYEQIGDPWDQRVNVPGDKPTFELPPILLHPSVIMSGKIIDIAGRPAGKKKITGFARGRRYGHGVTNERGEFSIRVPNQVKLEKYVAWEEGEDPRPLTVEQQDPLILRLK